MKAKYFWKLNANKNDNSKKFFDEINSKTPRKTYQTNKIVYNHLEETLCIDLADMIDYKTSNSREYRYIFIINDNFSKYTWAIPLKSKNSKTETENFPNIFTSSKRFPIKFAKDR